MTNTPMSQTLADALRELIGHVLSLCRVRGGLCPTSVRRRLFDCLHFAYGDLGGSESLSLDFRFPNSTVERFRQASVKIRECLSAVEEEAAKKAKPVAKTAVQKAATAAASSDAATLSETTFIRTESPIFEIAALLASPAKPCLH